MIKFKKNQIYQITLQNFFFKKNLNKKVMKGGNKKANLPKI